MTPESLMPQDEQLNSDRAMKALQLRHELQEFLSVSIADNGETSGGGGLGSEDIMLSVGGEAFHIQIRWKAPS